MIKRDPGRVMLCSTLAIATALVVGPTPAAAQALRGTVDSSIGVGYIYTAPGTTKVIVTSPQAVINWTATGPSASGVTTFSDPGSLTIFSGYHNFAILNRVTPSAAGNAILMGGDIKSLVYGRVGGTVYFYSPNGIVIGGNASINVGSLGLTTLPISDANGVWMSGFGGAHPQVAFGAATNGASYVRTQSGEGQITSNGAGHYVALVAPRIEHRGTIRTDSGAALVAASAATITFNPTGLYDIVVGGGSRDANGVVVDGGRIERNSDAPGGAHRAYLVAVPANNAMTMLVQGGASLGFDIAGSAAVEGNAVVLSAGHDVSNGAASTVSAAALGNDGDIQIGQATFTSRVDATALDYFRIGVFGGTTRFAEDLAVRARTGQIDASGAATQLLFDGDLSIDVSKTATAAGASALSAGYNILGVNGATITVAGSAAIDASARGGDSGTIGAASGSATGGTVFIQAQTGGTVNLNGGLTVNADAVAGSTGVGVDSGTGQGGDIRFDAVLGNSRLNATGTLALSANGSGGHSLAECNSCSGSGGIGRGGTVFIQTFGGANNNISINGASVLSADGSGTSGGNGASGAGRGGTVSVNLGTSGSVDFRGALTMSADGRGGDHDGGGLGGAGNGGSASVYTSGANTVTIDGLTTMSATGWGGASMASDGVGGSGGGGNVRLTVSGGTLNLLNNAVLVADAAGGGGAALGGHAQGGITAASAVAGALNITGLIWQDASAEGGYGNYGDYESAGVGGGARGGDASLFAGTGGSLTIGSVLLSAYADGGSGSSGGGGEGGHGTIHSNLGTIDIADQVTVFVGATGGHSGDTAGSAATGGRFELVAEGGTIDVGGLVYLSTWARGGATDAATASGGTGTGGAVQVHARNGGTLTLASALYADGIGQGGEAFGFGARSGDGVGGSVDLGAYGSSSTIDAREYVLLTADGLGGSSECGECYGGAGGGNGTGGQVVAQTEGGNGNRVLIGHDLVLSANGTGSDGYGGNGGNGQGGGAHLYLANDGQIAVGGGVSLSARGDGGYHSNGGQAGAGSGGDAEINLGGDAASSLTVGTDQKSEVDRGTTLDSSGYGGSAGVVAGGLGGAGSGGWSRIYGTGGRAEFHGDVSILAEGEGGDGEAGTGGAGAGGRARLNADGAAYRLFGGLTLDSDASGGAGRDGGAASMWSLNNEANSAILANRGGSVNVDGMTLVSASAAGGAGRFGGSGGSAVAGGAMVLAGDTVDGRGTITLGTLAAHADATGGSGDGGATQADGGAASGGRVALIANSNAAGASRINVGNTILSAVATGGDGGRGGAASNGLGGGHGGTGFGGGIIALAIGGSAVLGTGALVADASGSGGVGGHGGAGLAGDGGRGGDGGNGRGGLVTLGVGDGATAPADGGESRFGEIAALANSSGGRGGDGGAGTTTGAGGSGGSASAALIELIAKGGSLKTGAVAATANSVAGDGGAGVAQGSGGDAYTSNFWLIAHNASGQPAWRASADLGAITASLIATGGDGAPRGRTIARGGALVDIARSDVNLASYAAVVRGPDAVDPAARPDAIRLVDGDVAVAGGFSLSTDNPLSVHLDRSAMSAAGVTLTAPDFVDDASVGAPATMGTITAGSFGLATGRNMVLDAHLASLASLSLVAPGLVLVGNLSASGAASAIGLVAGTTIDTGTITASGAVDLRGGGNVSLGTVSGRGVRIRSNTATVAAPDITSQLDLIDISAAEDIVVGNLAADGATIAAGRDITAGDIRSAALGIDIRAGRALVTGDLSAVGTIGLGAGTSITTRAVTSRDGAIDGVAGTAITTSDVTAGGALRLAAGAELASATIDARSADLRAGGSLSIGAATTRDAFEARSGATLTGAAITAGDRIALTSGGALMAGNLGAARGAIDVRSGAALTVATLGGQADIALDAVGAITTSAITSRAGGIRAVGGDTIATGPLMADGGVLLDARGSITTGTIDARWIDLFALGNIAIGDATAREAVDMETEATLAAGNVIAGERIAMAARGALTAGNLSAGLVDAKIRSGAEYHVGVLSGASVALGNVAARDWIGIGSAGPIEVGAIGAGGDVLLAADGAIRTGAIGSGAQSRLLIAGAGMIALGQQGESFDRGALFAALGTSAAAATRGPVTIAGPITTGRLDALVGGDFTTSALTATSAAFATVGGLMTIDGAWSAPLSRIASNDLAIGDGGAVRGGEIDLLSTNATQLLVGDGLSGSGYALSNAEVGRVSGSRVTITGRGDASAAIDTMVGSLSLSGREAGSKVTIATATGTQAAGVLRVVGAVGGNGFGANDALTFAAGRVEVDATSGGIALIGAGNAPGGVLTLAGQRAHVAEASILDQLALDPAFAGRDAQLARPPAVARPDGVVRAGEIFVELISSGEQSAALTPYSVLVQNVGTSALPAGFFASFAEIVSPAGAAPGAIDLNIHGQLGPSPSLLTGVAVRDALTEDDDPARFTASSLINGCALTGACGLRQSPLDPQPAISSEIRLLSLPAGDDALFGNEEAIEDNEEDGGEDSASAPIAPPIPLFNTKPLEQKGDTDEPVSGGGNPALSGAPPVKGGQ